MGRIAEEEREKLHVRLDKIEQIFYINSGDFIPKSRKYKCTNGAQRSSRSLEGISKRIKETKVQIDNILKLLNDAAEYRSSESNIKLQWIMMIVTILSLFVALYSIKNGDVINEIKNLIEWIKTLIS